ncbi:porin [Candidatus Pelagibacter sp.]|uniref:porin n=1 Tax=Candidatus Pelagibacter sp. TaxID=2024849 RepID=UPI003F85A0CB
MNIKKVGLTALAASLVSVSAHAGAVSVAGGASINAEGYSGENLNAGTTFSMGNQLTFTGSGELDNGMNVSISFVLDQGDDTAIASGPFDSHSVTVSSDEMGTLVFSGEGGSSATTAMDASAAGNIWDTFDGARGTIVTAVAQSDSGPGNNSFLYTLPSMVDGLGIDLSYKPQGSSAESATGYGVSYTGIDGLTAKYSSTDIETGVSGTSGDHTAWHLSYVYGPVTATATNSEYDVGTASSDQELSSFAISYTISDELSVTYGEDTIEKGGDPTDAEYSVISASYTAGGMTLSASMKEAENVNHTTASNEDFEYWSLGASFAF